MGNARGCEEGPPVDPAWARRVLDLLAEANLGALLPIEKDILAGLRARPIQTWMCGQGRLLREIGVKVGVLSRDGGARSKSV